MRFGRTLPPAAAPLGWRDLWHGVTGMFDAQRSIRALEAEICQEFGVAHVFLVSSGTAALTLTLTALKSMSPRRDVVMPAFTCFSVAAAVLNAGLRPVLCDISPSTFDFNHALFQQTIDEQTLCVIAHHLFGIPSAIEQIRSLCERRGIFVVEDAAQAMGAEAGGRKLGTMGDIGIFSLGRGKNITCGSGGIVVTNSDRIAEAIGSQYRRCAADSIGEQLKELVRVVLMAVFIRPRLYWIPAALPVLRLGQTIVPGATPVKAFSGMKAGLLRNWRRHLARSNQLRAETAADFGRRLSLRLPHGPTHPYLRLPVVMPTWGERERIVSLAQKRGLGLSPAYAAPVNEIPEVRRVCNGKRFPCARKMADRLLTLPTHHWLSERDKRAIADLWA